MVLSEENYGTILAISDIHGYLGAAKSILAVPIAINEAAKEDPRIQRIDTVVFLGDNDMGYGPQQLECIDLHFIFLPFLNGLSLNLTMYPSLSIISIPPHQIEFINCYGRTVELERFP